MGNLFSELKRRNVVRVGIAYVVLGWVALQAGDILFDMFEAPAWVGKTFAALLLLGFPFACLFAWAFEMTPEGVKKTAEVDQSESITHSTGKKLNAVIMVALVVALGYFIWERQNLIDAGPQNAAVDRSIAVLPFINMSSDQEQEWFADGLTEEILNSLARTPDLLVASRTSSFQYKGQNTDISEITKALGVAHILEGSVRRGGDRLRVTAQLIRASDGFHLWSETFDRKQVISAGTSSVAAYEAYLEGLVFEGTSSSTGDPEDWSAAYAAYDRAANIDETFSLAHYRKAFYWESQLGVTDVGSDRSTLSPDEMMEQFIRASDMAIRYAPDEGRALLYRAFKADGELRFSDAIRLAEEYIALYPNEISGYSTLSDAAASVRDAAALRRHYEAMRILAKDDQNELNILLTNTLFVGLPEKAAEMAREVLPKFPQHGFVTYQSHRILLWVGANAEARKWIPAIRGAEFPEENIWLVELRQACADGDLETA